MGVCGRSLNLRVVRTGYKIMAEGLVHILYYVVLVWIKYITVIR